MTPGDYTAFILMLRQLDPSTASLYAAGSPWVQTDLGRQRVALYSPRFTDAEVFVAKEMDEDEVLARCVLAAIQEDVRGYKEEKQRR